MTPDELLTVFRTQIRLTDADVTPGHIVERVGLIRRTYPSDRAEPGAMIESPEGLGADPDAVIAEERDFFLRRGQRVEWKTYDHDEPADLRERLTAAGFVPEEDEAVIVGELDVLTAMPTLPEGVRIRTLGGYDPVDSIRELLEIVWGEGTRWMTEALLEERAAHPDLLDITVAEQVDEHGDAAVGPALCAAWVRYSPGTDFAGMWGGATHPEWRRRGLYRAVLAERSRLALERGYRFARVDASPDSEPILRKLGLHRIGTTTPFILDPESASLG
jgi:GNAT superfamily N-acetyltransferase